MFTVNRNKHMFISRLASSDNVFLRIGFGGLTFQNQGNGESSLRMIQGLWRTIVSLICQTKVKLCKLTVFPSQVISTPIHGNNLKNVPQCPCKPNTLPKIRLE